ATAGLCRCPNVAVTQHLVRINVASATSMRGAGACAGVFALESALDELALELRIDPAELRLKNIPTQDEDKKLPWSSNHFGDCIRAATERFGWSRRNPEN